MIFLSSFRPQANCPDEIWEHQIAANRSWTRVAESIFYFNKLDLNLRSTKTAFIGNSDDKPSIRQLAAFAGGMNSWVAILNADIVIPQAFRRVEDAIRSRACACVVSRRYNIAVDGDQSQAKVTDHGLDFFAATPHVWKAVANEIPDDFKMGRIVWDNWLINFFMLHYGNFCYDITPARVVFHPLHEHREDQNWEFNKNDPVLRKNNWPFHSIEA